MTFILSCDSFVEVEPSGPTDLTFFSAEKDVQEAKVGMYSGLRTTFWNTLVGVIASEAYAAVGDTATYDQATLQNPRLNSHEQIQPKRWTSLHSRYYSARDAARH